MSDGREPLADPIAHVLRTGSALAPGEPALLVGPRRRGGCRWNSARRRWPAAVCCWVLRDISARRRAEQQAAHADKMDAVGRVAAAVGGDFNNALTVITGYAGRLCGALPPSNPLHRSAQEILFAAERAAALTSHLLAFAHPAAGTHGRAGPQPAPWPAWNPCCAAWSARKSSSSGWRRRAWGRVRIGPALLEQMLVHLLTHARNTTPAGGRVVVETAPANIEPATARNFGIAPGAYVLVAVSDNGAGMDAAHAHPHL